MRISDWSSDVCSSDPPWRRSIRRTWRRRQYRAFRAAHHSAGPIDRRRAPRNLHGRAFSGVAAATCPKTSFYECRWRLLGDRKIVVEGKSVSGRVTLGGGRIIQKKNQTKGTMTH